jgi:hypothetical protein
MVAPTAPGAPDTVHETEAVVVVGKIETDAGAHEIGVLLSDTLSKNTS